MESPTGVIAGTFQASDVDSPPSVEPPMVPADGNFQPGVSIDQAAAVLGVSPSTVRRWVKEGRLRSEKVMTPQGHAFRVHLPSPEASKTGAMEGDSAPSEKPSVAGSAAPTVAGVAVPSMERAEAMAAYNAALVAPLLAELSMTRVKLLEQADRIAGQAETIGSLRAQLAAAEERIHSLEAPRAHTDADLTAQDEDPSTETPDPPRRPPEPSSPTPAPTSLEPNGSEAWWRRWWLAITGAGWSARSG